MLQIVIITFLIIYIIILHIQIKRLKNLQANTNTLIHENQVLKKQIRNKRLLAHSFVKFLKNWPEPIIIVKNNEVIASNKASKEKLRLSTKNIDKNFIKKILNRTEIDYMTKTYNLSKYNFDEFTIINFKDISAYKKLLEEQQYFVSSASHELKTPLTSIIGFAETLLLEENLSDNQKKFIQIIKNNAERLLNIVKDLLSLSKLQYNKITFSQIDIKDFFNSIESIFINQIKQKNLKVFYNINCKTVITDKDLLEHSIINILDNAIKYNKLNGEIYIKVYRENNNYVFQIKDTGIGIPTIKKDKIFEKFYVGNPARYKKESGTGLGLAIVLDAIKKLNGEIKVNSEINEFTEFIITLPIPTIN